MKQIAKITLQTIRMGCIFCMGLAIGVLASEHLTNEANIVRGDFRVFASFHKDNPNHLWLEVFNKKRGVGIAFSEDLFYTISMAISKTSNATLYVNEPKLIPNDTNVSFYTSDKFPQPSPDSMGPDGWIKTTTMPVTRGK